MCELFGYCALEPITATGLLRAFFADSRVHPDGWGLYRSGKNTACLHREPLSAFKSSKLARILENDGPADALIAHIRYATVGGINPCNVHPFQAADPDGRLLTLAHNGTCPRSAKLDAFIPAQRGTTDSERILLYLNDRLARVRRRKDGPLNIQERIGVIDAGLSCLSAMSRINLLMTDGELYYVRGNIKERLYCARTPAAAFFATRPFPYRQLNWQPIADGRLHVFHNGREVYWGEKGGSLFEPLPYPAKMNIA